MVQQGSSDGGAESRRLADFVEFAEWAEIVRRLGSGADPGGLGIRPALELGTKVPHTQPTGSATPPLKKTERTLEEIWDDLPPRDRWELLRGAGALGNALTAAYVGLLRDIRCDCLFCACEPEELIRKQVFDLLGVAEDDDSPYMEEDSPPQHPIPIRWLVVVLGQVPDPPWSLDVDVILWRVLFHSYRQVFEEADFGTTTAREPSSRFGRRIWAQMVLSLLGLAPGMTCASPMMSALRLPLRELLGSRLGAGALLGPRRISQARNDFSAGLAKPMLKRLEADEWIEEIDPVDQPGYEDVLWAHFLACLIFWLGDRSAKYSDTITVISETCGLVSTAVLGGGVASLRRAGDATARSGWLDLLDLPGSSALPWPLSEFVKILRVVSMLPGLGKMPRRAWAGGGGGPGGSTLSSILSVLYGGDWVTPSPGDPGAPGGGESDGR